MRRSAAFAFFVVFARTGLAFAQEAEPAPERPRDKSNSQFDLKQNKAGDAEASAARGAMAAGDCAGALSHFDASLKTAQEPEIRRDRGHCHDKLGNKHPALEDLRAYLAAKPNAPDAEQIRARVQQLEVELATGRPIRTGAKRAAADETDRDVYASSRGDDDPQKSRAKPVDTGSDYDAFRRKEELLDEALASPLRLGKGVVISAFVGVPRYFISDGDVSDFGFMAGGRAGYSTGKYLTLFGEVGLSGIGTGSEARRSNNGVMTALGAEVRLGLNDRASDQILIRAGVGYEHLINERTQAITRLVPSRLGLGYRHVFGPSFGLEVLVDGGPGVALDEDGNSTFIVGLAGSVGVAVGF